MKKKIIICSLVALIFVCVPLFSWLAVSGGDSVDFILPLSLKIDKETTESVIKVYRGVFVNGFAAKKSIKALINDRYNVLEEIYIVTDKSGEITPKVIRNNSVEDIKFYYGEGKELVEVVNNSEALFGNINPNINIEKIYCLDDSSYAGFFVYYITDNGNYIYYTDRYYTKKSYLLAEEELCDLAKAKCEYIQNNYTSEILEVDGVDQSLANVRDISKYEIVDFKPVFLETYKK